MNRSDPELPGAAGPEAAFDAFYRSSARRVLGHLYLTTGDLAAAEDAVAEAFARAWQRWPEVSRAESPEAWVRTVASRVAISNWHKLRNRLLAHGRETRRRETGDGLTPAGLGADFQAVADALRTLPARQREAIVLHHLADLRVADIAVQLQVAEGTVKAWLSRGRSALRAVLDDGSAPPDDLSRASYTGRTD